MNVDSLPLRSSFARIEELNIHYVEAGEGEVVLLVRGWPTSAV